ncbi:diaminopimelate decarboxylase [Cryomorpha ignava]|uniref:Diaminopimelate decarboxylase n=1 Tax=Cryomorpha ignava TaxID=101383 RepID=A0A7K3WJX6_9FLAO|nr:diaminopimelate decarboxylase [Cryomorpha ignava]NEN21929.1 diaminopimelate decarboxylase [Cryomorpha ignava]
MFNKEIIAGFQNHKTPFYYYDLTVLDETLKVINDEIAGFNYKVHYAIKANTNDRILAKIKEYGLGIDCVSGNEIKWAIKNRFEPGKIAFAGVGKTDEEIEYALKTGIFTFNVESLPELEVIDTMAGKMGLEAPIAIRFNPNVNAKTHYYITTGLEENKFGINHWELSALFELLAKLTNIKLLGLHFHIGSQILDLSVFKNLCNRVNDYQREFSDRGIEIHHINVGGGLGVNYQNPDGEPIPDFKTYFQIFKKFLNLRPNQELHFELGRSVVAQCASLISRVLYIKEGIKTNFTILDAGMTELIRPALYQSFHLIQNLSKLNDDPSSKYDVVGPICESSDCFGKAIALPKTERGDIIAIRSVGAYGEVMSSSYNLRDKAAVVYR